MLNDYELVYLAQEKNEDALRLLYNKYHNYIYRTAYSICKQYKFDILDLEDIDLECQIVFENAIDTYNQDKQSQFISYLKLCLRSKLTDILRRKKIKKIQIGNSTLSLDEEINGINLYDTLFYYKDIIDYNYIDSNELITNINKKINKYEKIILKLLLEGKKPEEISIILNTEIKKIYNTIYIIKAKIKNELV